MDIQMYDIDGNPLQGSFTERLLQFTKIDRLVGRTVLSNNKQISTVLLPYAEQGILESNNLYLFETAILHPNEAADIVRRHKTLQEAYDYHCKMRDWILLNTEVTVVREVLHERFTTPEKQDFTIHI